MTKTIVLVGPPGAGKSTVGYRLATRLGLTFRDSDDVIKADAGVAISEIFATEGESGFRQRELAAIEKHVNGGQVLALGGGAVTTAQVRKLIADQHVVWLDVDRDNAVRRVGGDTSRPLLAGNVDQRWSKLADERRHLYESVATVRVDTSNRSHDDVVEMIVAGLEDDARH